MINVNRALDIALFCPLSKKYIGEIEILPVQQQLFRKNGYYYFAKIGELPYAIVPEKLNDLVIKVVFSSEVIDP